MKKITAIILSLAICFTFIPFMDMSYGATFQKPGTPVVSTNWYNQNALELTGITPDTESLPEYTYCQIDWRIVGPGSTDDWKYRPEWDNKSATEWKIGEYYDQYAYGEQTILDFDYGDEYWWTEGFSKYIPEEAMIDIKYQDYNVKVINYDKYAVEVRARYIHFLDYDEDYNEIYEQSDWTDVVSYGNFSKDYEGLGNLLVNPDFEEGLNGWVNPDGRWGVDGAVEGDPSYAPKHGRYLAWGTTSHDLPSKDTYIYQDVSLEGHNPDETVVFNTSLCNYDQAPHDMGTVKLVFLDNQGKEIKTYKQMQRNPLWFSQSIIASIPEGAVTARVYLMGHRYVGAYIDAYYDFCSLIITPDKVYPIKVTEANGKDKAKAGEVLQLTANCNGETNPANYIWTSSYETAAVVDATGKVTMKTNAEDGVAIYARDINTGVTGTYWINCDEMNDYLPQIGTVKLGTTKYTYNGKVKTPTVTVKDKVGNVLTKNVDYQVTYQVGRAKVGKYSVKITGLGDYSGTKTLYFTIVPATPVVKSMTPGTKSLKVTMTGKPSTKGAATYQIAYRVKGTSAWKTTTTTSTYKTIKSLKKGKVYQVRVRAYKTVSGVKHYSAWSSVKTSKKVK